jgi:PAS domain S-box-containing protein
LSKNKNKSADELRRQAEKRLINSKKKGAPPETPEEMLRLVHELEVHQIELEMQNEELRQARSELEASLGQYTDLYDFAPAGYFTLDQSGTILHLNLTGSRMLGLERSRLLNQRFDRLVSADSRPAFTSLLAEVFQSRHQETFEITLQKEGNGELFVHVEARVSEDGRECRVALVDIAAQKKAEELLRESERKYRTLFETMSQGVVHQGPDGKIISANPAAERILGLSIDQMQGRALTDPCWRAIREDGSDFLEETHPSMVALRTGKAVQNVVMGIFSSQAYSYSWFNINAVPQFLPGENRPFEVFTTFEDITDRKRMETKLKKSEYEKGVILSSMSEKVVYHDPEMKICWANRSACDFFKKEPEEVVGKSCREILGRQAEDCKGCPVEVAIATGRYHQKVLELSGGKTMLISAYPVLEPDGHLTGVVEVSRDITDQIRIEAELKKAKEGSEEASQAKSLFLANISHEIRTPLSVIIGMADLVQESAHSQEQQEYIVMIRDSAASLLALINDVLDFSKIEAHRLELAQVQFDLFREVDKTISSLALHAEKKGLKLSYAIAEDIPKYVFGDPDRLHQVLLNLIGNAIKFTEKGEISVSLRQDGVESVEGKREAQDRKGVTAVRFSINDTGIGIPSDKVDWLFESFTQIDPLGIHKFEGTGLGLAISKSLVELMGGSIGVDSVENEGSTFYFTIPFALSGDTGVTTEALYWEKFGASVSDQPLPGQEKALEILLVEDKPMNQRLAKVLLEKKGHTVFTANDGEEALEKLKSQHFDLILMDIHMPKMDGLEAAARIRDWDEEAVRDIPIIAMTAYAMKEDRKKCLQAGMDYYLAKPINREELYYALDKVMENSVNELTQQACPPEDTHQMLNRLDGNTELLEELMEMFFQDYPQDIVNLKESMEKKDFTSLASVVHGLKGELGNMGMKTAYKIACELEKMIKDNTLEEASALIQELENEVKLLERFFSRPGWQGRL